MTNNYPSIASLNPVVLSDQRRVMMELVVENLPTQLANVTLAIPGEPTSSSTADPGPIERSSSPSPYPNVELTIINSQGKTVAATFIVEHQEEFTNLTLHLREPNLQEKYIARAEMTYQKDVLDVIEVPFTLAEAE